MINNPNLEIMAQIQTFFWWHSIDLGNGIVTPGQKSVALMQEEFSNTFSRLDLKGKSVLDVGAWNGGFSVEAARRGATRVAALDHHVWNDPRLRARDSIELVRKITELPIDLIDQDLDAPGLDLDHIGTFDIVLFLGVFYHLKDPIAALRQLSAVAREILILETYVECTEDPRPLMMFYPGAELANDETNWWGPNRSCVQALLNMVGFTKVEVSPGAPSPYRREIFHAYR
jgi:tRNA (mo5U34)-methyltransferase